MNTNKNKASKTTVKGLTPLTAVQQSADTQTEVLKQYEAAEQAKTEARNKLEAAKVKATEAAAAVLKAKTKKAKAEALEAEAHAKNASKEAQRELKEAISKTVIIPEAVNNESKRLAYSFFRGNENRAAGTSLKAEKENNQQKAERAAAAYKVAEQLRKNYEDGSRRAFTPENIAQLNQLQKEADKAEALATIAEDEAAQATKYKTENKDELIKAAKQARAKASTAKLQYSKALDALIKNPLPDEYGFAHDAAIMLLPHTGKTFDTVFDMEAKNTLGQPKQIKKTVVNSVYYRLNQKLQGEKKQEKKTTYIEENGIYTRLNRGESVKGFSDYQRGKELKESLNLTERQSEVLEKRLQGQGHKKIAKSLSINKKGVIETKRAIEVKAEKFKIEFAAELAKETNTTQSAALKKLDDTIRRGRTEATEESKRRTAEAAALPLLEATEAERATKAAKEVAEDKRTAYTEAKAKAARMVKRLAEEARNELDEAKKDSLFFIRIANPERQAEAKAEQINRLKVVKKALTADYRKKVKAINTRLHALKIIADKAAADYKAKAAAAILDEATQSERLAEAIKAAEQAKAYQAERQARQAEAEKAAAILELLPVPPCPKTEAKDITQKELDEAKAKAAANPLTVALKRENQKAAEKAKEEAKARAERQKHLKAIAADLEEAEAAANGLTVKELRKQKAKAATEAQKALLKAEAADIKKRTAAHMEARAKAKAEADERQKALESDFIKAYAKNNNLTEAEAADYLRLWADGKIKTKARRVIKAVAKAIETNTEYTKATTAKPPQIVYKAFTDFTRGRSKTKIKD